MIVDSIVPEIKAIQIKRMPKRTLKGTFYRDGRGISLFVTTNGTVYTDYFRGPPPGWVSRNGNPHSSLNWARSLLMAKLITKPQLDAHEKDLQAFFEQKKKDGAAWRLKEAAADLGIKLTKAQIKKAGL